MMMMLTASISSFFFSDAHIDLTICCGTCDFANLIKDDIYHLYSLFFWKNSYRGMTHSKDISEKSQVTYYLQDSECTFNQI